MVSFAGYSNPRRHSGIELPTHKRADDPPEGFMEHRKKHEATRPHRQGAGAPTVSSSPHFMQRPKSFDEQYRRPTQEEEAHPSTANVATTPMYDPGYNPFSYSPSGPQSDFASGPQSFGFSSGPWSEYWPFGPLKKPRHPRAKTPPHWAAPLSLPASQNPHIRKKSSTQSPLHVNLRTAVATDADDDPFASFRWPSGDLPKPFANTPSLRSQSTENIDLRFSSAGDPPKFGGGGTSFTKAPSGEESVNPIEISDNEGSPTKASGLGDDSASEKTPFGPPPKGPACFFPNDWHQRAWAGTFQADPGRSQSRASSQRRAGTPRASSTGNAKRAGHHRAPGFQPSVNDTGDEPPSYSTATSENLGSSRVSSEGSAMDIDPILTPPSGNDNQHQGNSNDVSPTRPNEPPKTPNQAPELPQQTAIPVHAEEDSLNIGFSDFNNVKPFGPSGDGLGAMDDLSQELPFESRASSNRPQIETTARGLKMPKPPKAPSPPKPLNPATWQSYVNAMASYMSNWANFNNAMLSHFHIRQEAQKQMNSGWMSVQGDGNYNAYMESLVEDEKVRKWWEVACDYHKDCINTLGEVRVAMKAETARVKNFPYPS